MDNIKKVLSQVDFYRLLILLYLLKCLIISVGFADAILLAVVTSLYAFTLHIKRFEKKDPDQKLREEINEIKAALSKRSLEPSQNKKSFKF